MIVPPAMIQASTVAPVPTVVPTPPEHVVAGDVGNRTLWYASPPRNTSMLMVPRVVVVIMALSSLAFYGMAFRVSAVSLTPFPPQG